MGLNDFFNAKLKCTHCGRIINSGEDVFIHLTLPNEKKMPVGVLDKVLSRYSNTVYCKNCYSNH